MTFTMQAGVPWFIATGWVDSEQTSIRNRIHDAGSLSRHLAEQLRIEDLDPFQPTDPDPPPNDSGVRRSIATD